MFVRSYMVALASVLAASACGNDPGKGRASFTTWGEDYIEHGIPADPAGQSGFVDGWSLHYDKFLVVFHEIEIADASGEVAEHFAGSKLVDNVVPGRKGLVSFAYVEAKHWDRVSYQIKPATPDSQVVAGNAADRDMMVQNGYSVYVEGSATKLGADGAPMTKTFHWGFKTATQYSGCQQAAESGQPIEGIVITNGGEDTAELTTHGDHLFYDRLMASANPAIKTSLRFEEKAAADTDGDGEITLAELEAAPIDVRLYDPSGLDAPSLGAFMGSLARTIGHFKGEGECTVSRIAP
ncbi:MAG: hypothetical protein QM778_30055 [Myxococcales bacterium]